MIARCIRNTGTSLGKPRRSAFHTVETVFHVTVCQEYSIGGLGLFETTLLALALDDTGKPNWLPVGLFDLTDAETPVGWRFAVLDGAAASGAGPPGDDWVALWGYPELVHDRRHRDGLVERDPSALEVFFREVGRNANKPASSALGSDGCH
jgi:hypothetical protein